MPYLVLILILLASNAFAATPVAHWKFDETSGTVAADSSGNGYNGTLVNFGASPWVSGGLSFDGANDRVDVGSPAGLDNLQSFTYAVKIYLRSIGENGYGVLFNKGGSGGSGSKRWLTNNTCNGAANSIELSVNRATTSAWACAPANTITFNVWVLLVATFDPTDGPRLYFNGLEVTYSVRNIGAGALQDESAQNLTLGSWPDGSGASNVIMDDARVYGAALTAQEVLDLYNSYFPPPPPPPPGPYYPPPEGSGGWRRLVSINATPTPEEKANILSIAGVDWDALKLARDYAESVSASTVLVIRNGWIAGEWGSTGGYLVHSVTKSLTGLAFAKLFDMSDVGQLMQAIGPESLAYAYLGPSFCLCDHRRYQMKVKHLMTMSSGLQPADPDSLTQSQRLTRPMDATSETSWVYSSLDPNLLSMILQPLASQSLAAFFNTRIGSPIGAAAFSWETIDGGFSKGAAGVTASARDLARVAWLTMQNGVWDSGGGPQQIVSSARISLLTQWPSFLANTTFRASPGSPFPLPTDANTYYGHLFWTNRNQAALGVSVPADAYYMHGFNDNLVIVVPSRNLIVVRLATGGPGADQAFRQQFMSLVMASLVN